jgi:hypothetical protein
MVNDQSGVATKWQLSLCLARRIDVAEVTTTAM